MKVYSFHEAMKQISHTKNRHLLLGNGFSISLKPDIFTYESLFDNADFSKAPHIPKLFDALGTRDFETVIRSLQSAATILENYPGANTQLALKLRDDSAIIKDALVQAIAKRHPDRPYDIDAKQYAACRVFLSNYSHIFTLNYDVLLYWSLMQRDVDKLDLRPDDGFRHPEDDPDLPYVSWQQSQSATVHYLHGALHLFDQNTEVVKYTWSKTDKAIVDQVREALNDDRFPIFVAEGTTESKTEKILHNAYLHKGLRSFESCCGPSTNAIVVFGHSLADNDSHILRCISSGGAANLLVGLYGDATSANNKAIITAADQIVAERKQKRGDRFKLAVSFYDATSAHVWA